MENNTALTTIQPQQPQQFTLAELQTMAVAIAKSGIFPSCKTPENAMALMLLCQAEGIHPMQAARRFHIINGTCSMRSDAMQAEFMRQGGKVKWIKSDAAEAKAEFSHASAGSTVFSFTTLEAEKAGLVKPGSGWSKFPAAMCRARCISGGIRMILPGVVCGLYTDEEVADFQPQPQVQSKPQAATTATSKPPVSTPPATQQQPFQAENIEDAKIIEQLAPEAPAPQAPVVKENLTTEPPPASSTPPAGKNAGQVASEIKLIRKLLQDYGAKNIVEMAKMLSEVVNRPIESTQQLTCNERTNAIETLRFLIKQREEEQAKATQPPTQEPAQEQHANG